MVCETERINCRNNCVDTYVEGNVEKKLSAQVNRKGEVAKNVRAYDRVTNAGDKENSTKGSLQTIVQGQGLLSVYRDCRADNHLRRWQNLPTSTVLQSRTNNANFSTYADKVTNFRVAVSLEQQTARLMVHDAGRSHHRAP